MGLDPQTKLQASQNGNMKHYKSVEFCQILGCQAPSTNVKFTYWRLSGDGSGPNVNVCAAEENVEEKL